MSDVLFLETRKKIFVIVQKNPGLSLSEIANHADLSIPLVDYHLRYMVHHQLLSEVKEQGYKRYYVKGQLGTEDKKMLSIIQQTTPLQIILYFLEHHHGKPQDILKEITISSALLTYYLKKLVKNDILTPNTLSGKKDFILVNEQRIINLLIQYKPNVLLQRFTASWVEEIPLSSKLHSSSDSDDEKEE